MLLSITKLQNLKAIHNVLDKHALHNSVVINHKTTKFESNSQRYVVHLLLPYCCYQSQNYKIWKQFTTNGTHDESTDTLLSITKLQNLKAIHNRSSECLIIAQVVINHKTTKFESNSQHQNTFNHSMIGCYQSQNYKIWKQFTTKTH